MSLSDPNFLLLLALTVLGFYTLRGHRRRAALLLGVSYAFYFKLSGRFGAILIFITAVSYGGAWLLSSHRKAAYRDWLFVLLAVLILLPLLTFKYLGFLLGVAASVVEQDAVPALPGMLLVLPIGISFFTFVALGYLSDVYLEVIEPEVRPLEFALLLAFFPVVTAGPIERAGHFLPQFDFSKTCFSSERALAASRLIFVGLFLKVVCADNLVGPVDTVFAEPEKYIATEKLYALIHFMYYAYADFAGYSLIAIGSAMFFGLEVRPNFRQPFLSETVAEFWRNWHISMSSWFRDYVFTPLRMHWRRYPTMGIVGALMISFVLIGLWHGAGWGFILFGTTHGLLVVCATLTTRPRAEIIARLKIPGAIVSSCGILITFVLVMLTLVLYRANSLNDAAEFYRDLFSKHVLSLAPYFHPAMFKVISFRSWTWAAIAAVFVGDILAKRGVLLEGLPIGLQLLAYNAGAALIVYGWIAHTAAQPFLYYRF